MYFLTVLLQKMSFLTFVNSYLLYVAVFSPSSEIQRMSLEHENLEKEHEKLKQEEANKSKQLSELR